MNRLISGVVMSMLMVNVLALSFNVKPAGSLPATLIVPDNYATIQAAVNAASPGDTVHVRAGTYPENIVVGKALSLVGENPHNTIIDGGGVGNVLTVTADYANVTGFTMQNGDSGISLDGANYCNVTGNNIAGNGSGIYLGTSSGNSVSGNNITANNWNGIALSSSSNNGVSGNNITGNDWDGIILGSSSNYNSVSGNNIAGNGDGIILGSSSNYNSVSGNNITANNKDGIYLGTSSGNSVSGNNITANNGKGIWLSSSSGNSVSGNNMTANDGAGIMICCSSSNNGVSGNNITANNGYGIDIDSSSSNKIFHNNFVNNNQVYSSGSANIWDDGYPSGGNYWSDCNGTDVYNGPSQNVTGSDGIGDTPYVIDANSIDHYPLMNVFPIPEFPSTIAFPLFLLLLTLAIMIVSRKHARA